MSFDDGVLSKDLEQEIGFDYRERIADYADEKVKYIIKHR